LKKVDAGISEAGGFVLFAERVKWRIVYGWEKVDRILAGSARLIPFWQDMVFLLQNIISVMNVFTGLECHFPTVVYEAG
jgi:hypothetical protein